MESTVVGLRFRTQREKHGLQVQQAAERLGLHRVSLSRLETGRRGKNTPASVVAAAARLYGVPEYYFTAPTPQEYMRQRSLDLSPEEAAMLETLAARIEWAISSLEEDFPHEFTVLSLLRSLGLAPQDLDAYRAGKTTPESAFLQDFAAATGVTMAFLRGGRKGQRPGGDEFPGALRRARELGMTDGELLQAIEIWCGR